MEVDGQLAQPGAHPAGETDRDRAERVAEVGRVQPVVERDQSLEPDEVAGPRALAPDGTRWRRRVQLDGKAQEDPLGAPARGPRQARVEEPHDGAQDAIGRAGVPAVHPENAAREADHDGPIGVREDPVDVPQAQQGEAVPEQVVHPTGPEPPATETATRGCPWRAKEFMSEVRNCRPAASQR